MGLEVKPLERALETFEAVTRGAGGEGSGGRRRGMLGHSADFLSLAAITVVGWVWAKLATAAAARGDAFGEGLGAAWRYWSAAELSRVPALGALCDSGERSFVGLREEWL